MGAARWRGRPAVRIEGEEGGGGGGAEPAPAVCLAPASFDSTGSSKNSSSPRADGEEETLRQPPPLALAKTACRAAAEAASAGPLARLPPSHAAVRALSGRSALASDCIIYTMVLRCLTLAAWRKQIWV